MKLFISSCKYISPYSFWGLSLQKGLHEPAVNLSPSPYFKPTYAVSILKYSMVNMKLQSSFHVIFYRLGHEILL